MLAQLCPLARATAACHVSQNQVHGLLGQRAISPAPMKQPPIEQQGGGKEQSEFAAQATTNIAAALGLGGGGIGTSTAIRTTVQADGHLQGEGAIEGSYLDYKAGFLPCVVSQVQRRCRTRSAPHSTHMMGHAPRRS